MTATADPTGLDAPPDDDDDIEARLAVMADRAARRVCVFTGGPVDCAPDDEPLTTEAM